MLPLLDSLATHKETMRRSLLKLVDEYLENAKRIEEAATKD